MKNEILTKHNLSSLTQNKNIQFQPQTTITILIKWTELF